MQTVLRYSHWLAALVFVQNLFLCKINVYKKKEIISFSRQRGICRQIPAKEFVKTSAKPRRNISQRHWWKSSDWGFTNHVWNYFRQFLITGLKISRLSECHWYQGECHILQRIFFFNWQCLKQVGEIFWLSERCRKYRSDRVSCCTHCRGALSQNIYWHPRKFAESFALTGRRGDIKSLFGSALDYVPCLHCHPHRRAVRANRGEENCCCLTLSFSSASLQKPTKYRNHIIFNDVPATTMQGVKMLPQTPKWAQFLLNLFQRNPEQCLERVTSCTHNHLKRTEH